MRSTFNILFYINRQKIKKNGKCPIMGRITVDGKLTQFSVKEEITPCGWSAKEGRSIGKEKSNRQLNLKLEHYEQQLTKHYTKQVEENAYVTAESLKQALLTGSTHEATLLEEFRIHNEEYFKSVGISKSKGSYNSYIHAYKSLEKFISQKHGAKDIDFRELQYSFIEDFEFFLRFNLNFSINTSFNVLMKLKHIVHRAIHKEIIRKNPFADFICKQEKTIRKWLSKTDLDKIMNTPMNEEKLEKVRLLFIFSTFTGLAFTDLYNLKHENISTDSHSITWIRIKRQKTGTESIIPLLDIALAIYKKHKRPYTETKVFDVPYYALVRLHLEEIRKITKLKVLNFHMRRHIHFYY